MNDMTNLFLRRISAFGLLVSLTAGAVSPIFAQQQQTQPAPQPQQQDDKTDKKDKKTNGKEDNDPAKEAVELRSNRPLKDNENPDLIGKRNINKGFSGKLGGSQRREVELGRQLSAEVEKEAKLVDDPMITEYVNRVGQNIVNHSDAKVPFTIKVIDSDEVNAFALPGGFFYVNKGLILAADNESELAGVMAHEIGHVAARHAVENQGKANLIQWGLLAGVILSGGVASSVLYNGGGLIQALAQSKFSRSAEWEADKLGLQYMYAAGYDPTAMSTMFEKLVAMNKKKPGSFSKLFSSHPPSAERRDAATALAARFAEHDEYVLSTSEFQRVKNHLLKISNAKATVAGDINDSDNGGRPTLKRRAPQSDDSTTTTSTDDSTTKTPDSTTDKSDEQKDRPQLKRRGEDPNTTTPAPSPSPTPKPNN